MGASFAQTLDFTVFGGEKVLFSPFDDRHGKSRQRARLRQAVRASTAPHKSQSGAKPQAAAQRA